MTKGSGVSTSGWMAALKGQFFLICTVVLVGIAVGADKLGNGGHMLADHWWLVLPAGMGLCQLVMNLIEKKQVRAVMEDLKQARAALASETAASDSRKLLMAVWERRAVRILDNAQLTKAILDRLPGFQGDFLVYNAEMNTIENSAFWKALCSCEGIRNIRIAIPPHAFKHVEERLRDKDIRDALSVPSSKIRLLPIEVPQHRAPYAYALLNGESAEHESRMFIFPKFEPCASYRPPSGDDATHRTPWDIGGRWDYEHIVETPDSPLLTDARQWFAANWKDEEAFTIEEMCRFTEGRPLQPKHIQGIDAASLEDAVTRLRSNRRRPVVGATTVPADMVEHGATLARTLSSDFGHGTVYGRNCRRDHADVVLLWLPPWGFPDWPVRLKHFDEDISAHVAVVHLSQYSTHSDEFSVTAAVEDVTALVEDILRNPSQYGVVKPRIILAGTSISAFVAAEVAAKQPEHIVGLCLLAPVLDIFDALDTFRAREGIALFTRRAYFGKPMFQFSDLEAPGSTLLRFFNARAGPALVLDLPLRGAAMCGSAFMQANLGRFTRVRRNRVLIGSHAGDQMTPWRDVESMQAKSEPGHSTLTSLSWVHDLNNMEFRCDSPCPDKDPDWAQVREFIVKLACSALVDVPASRSSVLSADGAAGRP